MIVERFARSDKLPLVGSRSSRWANVRATAALPLGCVPTPTRRWADIAVAQPTTARGVCLSTAGADCNCSIPGLRPEHGLGVGCGLGRGRVAICIGPACMCAGSAAGGDVQLPLLQRRSTSRGLQLETCEQSSDHC